MGIINWRGAGQGLGAAMEESGMSILKSTLDEQRQARLAELQAGYASRAQDRTFAQADKSQAAGFANDRSMVEVRETSRREGSKYDVENIDPLKNANALELAKKSAQAKIDIETSPENVQKTIDSLNLMEPAKAKIKLDAVLAELKAKSTPEALAAGRAIAQSVHIESAASVAQAKLAGKQAELADLSIADKKRYDALHTQYLAETDPAKKDAIADQLYTLAGKDKFQPVVGKDDTGNPKFVGGFNTRTGLMGTGARPGQTQQPTAADQADAVKRAKDPKFMAAYAARFGADAAAAATKQPPAPQPDVSATPATPGGIIGGLPLVGGAIARAEEKSRVQSLLEAQYPAVRKEEGAGRGKRVWREDSPEVAAFKKKPWPEAKTYADSLLKSE